MRLQNMCLLISLLLLIAFRTIANADYTTNLMPGGYIQDGGSDLDVQYWSAPAVYDWDSDGAKDLIIGRKADDLDSGYVSFYRNYGSDNSPVFNGYTDIQACSAPACTNGGG